MTEEELNHRIGSRVYTLRKRIPGMTQAKLAWQIDSDKQNISRLERGRVNPGAYFLYKIAREFKMSLSELLDFEE